jgi:glycerophosphoryl diester phosphodiesterase
MRNTQNDILIIGHRGASAISPANTLKAFKKAIELKADYVEFDIHITKDEEIVIIHDSDTYNTTGVNGLVKDMTLEQLKQLNAGDGEKIPTLKELISIANNKIGLQIEIKATNLLEKLIDILKKENLLKTPIISSFMIDELLKLKQLKPELKVGLLTSVELRKPKLLMRKIDKIAKNDFFSIHPYYSNTNKEVVDYAHDLGLKVIVWTVNDKNNIENLIEIGVDGIITDDISLTNDVFGKKF